METGTSFVFSSDLALTLTEARSETVSSALGEGSTLVLSCSEEGGDASAERDESVDLPPQSVLFEELLEVVTRAVAELNIDWPAEKECQECPKIKLDERFLRSKSPPLRRGLPFFPDLYTGVSRSWNKPYLARLYPPSCLGLIRLWWVMRTWRRVRLEVACTLWRCCKHTRLTF